MGPCACGWASSPQKPTVYNSQCSQTQALGRFNNGIIGTDNRKVLLNVSNHLNTTSTQASVVILLKAKLATFLTWVYRVSVHKTLVNGQCGQQGCGTLMPKACVMPLGIRGTQSC